MHDYLEARRKRRTIKRYITDLGPLLARTYGKSTNYSPKRVRDTLQNAGLPTEYEAYALVIYCTPDQFAADQAAQGGTAQYWPLRVEITEYDFRHGHEVSGGGTWDGQSSADHDAITYYSSIDSNS